MIAEIKEEQKNIDNLLFNYYFIKYQSPSDMYKKLRKTKGKKNEDQVYSIKEILDQIKKSNKSAKKYMIKKNENIVNIVERILYYNQLEQQDLDLKILIPNQMLSRLPITLGQLMQEIILKNLKNETRQSLYSLYRSKRLPKQL